MPEIGNAWRQFAPSPLALKPGKEWNVFLSYRSVNRPWVINLYDVLRTFGHTVFLDQVAMAAGDRLTKSLERALEKSQAGVLVWSSAAADSDWVHDEYAVMKAQADEGDFHFVPVRLDATKLPSFAATRIFLDFSQYPDGPNGGELLRLLHAVVGKPLSEDAARFASQQDEVAARDTARVKAAVKNGAAAEIQRLFDDGGDPWHTSAALGCLAAEGLTKLKEYDRALSMLQALEDRFPRAIRPKQLRALALARRAQANDLEQAQAILGELYELKQRDPETLGIYGRTWMDRYNQSKNMLHLRMSREMYAEAFEGAQDDYYTGINAAAKSILLSTPADVAKGQEFAERVRKIVGDASVRGDYWKTATVGEVQLMLGHYAEAAARYGDAVAMAPNELGSHESTWTQACRLMAAMGTGADDRSVVRGAFAHLADCS